MAKRTKFNKGPYMKNHRPCWIENGVCMIPLPNNIIAICDEDRFDEVKKYNWFLSGGEEWPYPSTKVNGKSIKLHIFLYPNLGLIDHINGNTLDNRSCNLRPATAIENRHNASKQKNNKSGYKGVSPIRGKWQATIAQRYLGVFISKEDAAMAVDREARKLYGKFAKLNFPEKEEI